MFTSFSDYINLYWVYSILLVVYALTTISIIVVVLSENRNPVKSLAWVTVLLMLPVIGIVLYIFFGRSIKNTRMISRRNRRRLKKQEKFRNVDISKQGLSDESVQLIKLGRALTGAIYYTGNELEIFTNGTDKFNRFIDDISNAKRYINLQYYIFENDRIGKIVSDLLIERAQAGVKVRIIYDHVGSIKAGKKFFKRMLRAGIEAYPFFKVNFPPFGTRINWRNHRKLAIIDGVVGYIGGMNIADRYIDGGKKFETWRDTHIRITGPAISALQYSFAVDWNFMGQPLIEEPVLSFPVDTASPDSVGMQMLTSGPTSQWSNIEFIFHKAIAGAKSRVFIQTPYFLPTEGLLRALQTAALSGVDVRIMMPLRSDSFMLTHSSFSYIMECLQSGIKIFVYEAGMLHAKTIIVDDDFTSIGSTNFDFRSFEHNFEANTFIYSQKVCKQMYDIFCHDLKSCRRIDATKWRKRPIHIKAVQSLLRLLSPIL